MDYNNAVDSKGSTRNKKIGMNLCTFNYDIQIPTHPPGSCSNNLAGNAIADLKLLAGLIS